MTDKKDVALKLALEQAYLAGFNASADGYNGECGVGNASQCTQWLTERDNYIREALAEKSSGTEQPTQPQQEPVAWWNPTKDSVSTDPVHRHNKDCQPLYTSPPAQQQEPVLCINPKVIDPATGKVRNGAGALTYSDEPCAGWSMPLYEHPPAQRKPFVGLTADEIAECCPYVLDEYHFARAIEAKLREKNA